MRRLVDRTETLARQVRVDLRGREVGVTEELLHGAEVGAPLEQMGGVGVTERVWMERLPVGQRMPGDDPARVAGGEATAPGVEEHGVGRRALGHQLRSTVGEVPAQRRLRRLTERDAALLRALAEDREEPAFRVERFEREPAALAD